LPDETTEQAAERRLLQEMGFSTHLTELFSFTYKATVENDLVEHEFDHVFAGEYEGAIHPAPGEVAAYEYRSMDRLKEELNDQPASFTSWFKIAFPRIEKWWKNAYLTKAE
jgi:isopentenyl-diphosphate delta-isomerase